MKFLYAIFTVFLTFFGFSQSWKALLNDNSVNFYDVCNEVEAYFLTHDKDVKGSGWKPYQRWKAQNEYKYFPSGDRSNIDPYFVKNAYTSFLANSQNSKILHPNGWVDLGPFTIDSITGHYAAGLGRVEDFHVSPTNENIIYLASRSGGLWKTTDGGNSWSTGLTDNLFSSGVNSISVSNSNPDSLLINVRNASNGTSHGIYRSINGGNTWEETAFNPTNLNLGGLGSNFNIYKVAYHPRVPNLVFVGTSNGIYRSDDNLQTWSLEITFGDISEIEFHPTDNNILYIFDSAGGNNNTIEISEDQGISYTSSSTITGNNGEERIRIRTSPVCDSCVYFASSNGVWRSTDNGQNFTFLSNPASSCDGFAVSDLDTTKMIYGYVDLFNSLDGGQTFEEKTRWSLGNTNGSGNGFQESYETSTNYIHADVRELRCLNGVFYAATDGFLCKSNDNGANWEIINEGTGIRENYKLGISQSNQYEVVVGSQDNGYSLKKKDKWVEFYGADGMEGIVHPLNNNWLITSLQYGGRRRSKDGGLTQSGVTPSGSNDGYWEAPIAYDPNNQMSVFDFRDKVYRSDNFGETHVELGSPASFGGTIEIAEIAQNNTETMVIVRNNAIDLSIDGGLTFTSIKNNLPGFSITDVAFDPKNDSTIIVTNGAYQNNNQKIYISHNQGASWTNISHNINDMPLHSVVIDHTAESRIYIGAEIGVYSMPMNGTNWELFNTNLANVTVEELEINFGSNTLKAATWGRGLWENTLIGRETYPAILTTSVSEMPTASLPKEGTEQYVTSTIHYNGNLESAYIMWSANNLNFDNIIAMFNISDSTYKTYEPIPDYPAGTKIYFKVFATGQNNEVSETYKFMYEVKPFEYCDASGNDTTSNPYIEEVNINGVVNLSGNNGYTEYSSVLIPMTAGQTYPIEVFGSTGWVENDYAAWIDYNGDRVFNTEERILFSTESGNSADTTFTIPDYVINNEVVTLRIRNTYWGQNPEPCGLALGEVEDYFVKFTSNNVVDLEENQINKSNLYPNPNNGNFTIALKEKSSETVINIYSILGNLIFTKTFSNQKVLNLNPQLSSGSYIVEIRTENNIEVKKLVIE